MNLSKYYTPEWMVKPMIDILPDIFPDIFNMDKMGKVEPFCGDGAISRFFPSIITNDIDDNVKAISRFDMNNDRSWRILSNELSERGCHGKIIITNPPFSNATFYVEQALKYFKNVVMLLRLSWLEPCKGRKDIILPNHIFPTSRHSFSGDGKSDSVTTAWFIWNGDNPWQKSIIKHIINPEKK